MKKNAIAYNLSPLIPLLLLLIITTWGCDRKSPIKIGFVGGLTGRLSDLGIAGRNGAQLAIENINKAGGVNGHQVELIIKNNEQKSETVLKVTQELIDEESQRAPADLVRLIDKVLELADKDYNLKKKYDFRNINIIREFDSNLPLVPCNETEIEQVILNLLSNAAWAMFNGKNDLLPQIILRVRGERQMVRLEVEDNGPGMDENAQKRAFEPFFTTKPVGEGTGLGLSVSYMIVTNNHQGTMEVESELGKGTKFLIRLPLN